jgi:phage recombination protein Bet
MSKVTAFPNQNQENITASSNEQKFQKETIQEYLKAYGFDKALSKEEIQQFTQTALAGNLDPFKREIYAAVYGEGEKKKVSILTGYQVYLKRAERTGKLDGWQARIEGSGSQMKAVVEIFRKDWSHSFIHEVYWEEAVQKKKDGNPTQFWIKQPRFQLRKVAMAQAFRLAFPDELGGLPYESAELPDNENILDGGFVKTSISNDNADLADNASDDNCHSNNSIAPEPDTSPNEDDYKENILQQIEDLFEAHPTDFNKKHKDWILDKVHKAADKAGALKMLAYTQRVIKKPA